MSKIFPGEHSRPTEGILAPVFCQHLSVYRYLAPKVLNKKVFEIGCGEGYGADLFAQCAKTVLAVDINRRAIIKSKQKYKKPNLNFQHMNFPQESPLQKFDIIISFQVIEHLQNPQPYLKRIQTLLKKDGFFFLSTPNSPVSGYNENPYHFKEYTKQELERVLRKYFSEVKILGLLPSLKIKKYEVARRKRVLRIFSWDILRIRHILPRWIRILLFNFLALITRKLLRKDTDTKVSVGDFKVSNKTEEVIDLIAICQKE